MAALFTIDLEWDYHAVRLPEAWPPYGDTTQVEIMYRLLRQLERHHVKAIVYIVGEIALHHPQLVHDIHAWRHTVGNHGYWHRHGERQNDTSYHKAASTIFTALDRQVSGPYPYRSPFWDTTPRPALSGGFFFRVLPYPWLKQEIVTSGIFYVHPHDFMKSPEGPWRRRLRICDPWERLERLLQDVQWKLPS